MTDKTGALLRDLRRPRHYNIDNEFIDDGYAAAVNTEATGSVTIYNILCRCANIKTSRAFPSIEYLVQKSGYSEAQVKRCLKALIKFRIISKDVHVGRGKTNDYCLLDLSEWAKSEKGFCQTPFSKRKKSQKKGSVRPPEKGSVRPPEQTNSFEQKSGGGGSCFSARTGDNVEIIRSGDVPEILELEKPTAKPPLPLLKKLTPEEEQERRNYLKQQALSQEFQQTP